MSAHVVISCEQTVDDGVCGVWFSAAVADVHAAREQAAHDGWTHDGAIDVCPTCARPHPRVILESL